VASSARESVTKTATARRRPSGKSDQADIIGGRGLTIVFARCACFVGQNRSYGKTGAESIAASHRIGKRLHEKVVGFGRKRRVPNQAFKQLHSGGGRYPVAVLCSGIAMQAVLAILQLKLLDSQGAGVILDDRGAPDDAEQHVGRGVVASAGGRVGLVHEGEHQRWLPDNGLGAGCRPEECGLQGESGPCGRV
jgi:hypothetical protein